MKRWRGVSLALLVSAFITLDFALLYLNFVITHRLEEGALIINVSGRQRMLSQRMAKDLLLLQQSNPRTPESALILPQLKSSAELFDTTLAAFQFGGELTTAEAQTQYIAARADETSQQLLAEAQTIWQPVFAQLMNLSPGEVLTSDSLLMIYAREQSVQLLRLMNDLTVTSEHISKRDSMRLRFAQLTVFVLAMINFLGILRKLHKRNQRDSMFRRQLEHLIENTSEAVLLADTLGKVVYSNHSAEQVFDLPRYELSKKTVAELIPATAIANKTSIAERTYNIRRIRMPSQDGVLEMVSLIDITEKVELQEQSSTDRLTGLYNRFGLLEAAGRLARKQKRVSCLFLDLDKFKPINDLHGHAVGDEVLQILAKRFSACIKEQDILARIGGDEFIILLPQPKQEQDLLELCQRIVGAIGKPVHAGEVHCEVGVSIGVCQGDFDHQSLDQMIEEADKAMYEAKAAGGTQVIVHKPLSA